LDGIHDQEIRFERQHMLQNRFKVGLGEQQQVFAEFSYVVLSSQAGEAQSAHFDLAFRFLTRDV